MFPAMRIAVFLGALLVAGLVVVPSASAQNFATDCSSCHGTSGARINAANAGAVITSANTRHGMGLGAGVLAAVNTYAAELGTLLAASLGPHALNVGYRTTGNTVSVPSVVVSDPADPANAVITSLGVPTPPTGFGTVNGAEIGRAHV